jgi:transcriptional regulator with XRE-family HTH domain
MEMKDQIRIAREAAGLSPQELADKLGVSRQTILWWECGEHRPKTGRIRELEECLNVRLDLAERGNATPLNKVKGSLSVDPDILRLAVAIGRLPARHREALATLAHIGESKMLGNSSQPEKLILDSQKSNGDTLSVEEPIKTSGEFNLIEEENNGSSRSKAGSETSKPVHRNRLKKAS